MKKIIAVALLGLLCFLTVNLARPTAPPKAEDDFTLTKVAEGVFAGISVPTGLAGSNAGFIIGDDGVIVVDTYTTPQAAEELLAQIEQRTSLPIKYVVNSHYHLDHVGGNQVFAARNIPIIAQANVRDWITTKNVNHKFISSTEELQKRRNDTQQQLAKLGADDKTRPGLERRLRMTDAMLTLKITPPTITYTTEGMHLFLGKREVVLFTLPGHTGGDTLVYVPDANVLFTGDMGWSKSLPNLIDATVNDWIPSLEQILRQYPTAKFVPGHGPVADSADVQAFHDYLVDLRTRVKQAISEGKTLEQAQEQLAATLPDRFKSFGIQGFVKPNISDMYKELNGTKEK
ncbi:MAG TPA: MBL fold metallo-hydrolase [Blastocatellia bacterium]|nr:MBL fold metallo-hydrolase [Blastocatellia bacterium]